MLNENAEQPAQPRCPHCGTQQFDLTPALSWTPAGTVLCVFACSAPECMKIISVQVCPPNWVYSPDQIEQILRAKAAQAMGGGFGAASADGSNIQRAPGFDVQKVLADLRKKRTQ